jgi:hypothetical protein
MAYFLPLAWVGLTARWATDDAMNIAGYWDRGWPKLIAAQLLFFSPYYRPMGGLFYMPLFEAFGMNPFPYRAGLLLILGLNALLAYRAAKMLSRSVTAALLAAVFTSYHGGMFVLFYNTSQLYDVLCFLFWFAALNVYLTVRSRGRDLTLKQTAWLLVLYICALNSKEMAVTLPVAFFAHELVFASDDTWKARLWRARMPLGAVVLITIAFVIGKTVGPNALSHVQGYRPSISLTRFLVNNGHYAAELFYYYEPVSKYQTVAFWALLAYLAFRRYRPYLRWALVMVIFGALPIVFIRDYGGGCLYLVVFGYALFVASLVSGTVRWLSRERIFRWVRFPRGLAQSALVCGAIFWYASILRARQTEALAGWQESQRRTWIAIQEMQRIRPEIRHGSSLLFMNDPFTDWDMHFIVQVVLRERASKITLQRTHDHILSPEEIAAYDYVLRFENGRLIRLR